MLEKPAVEARNSPRGQVSSMLLSYRHDYGQFAGSQSARAAIQKAGKRRQICVKKMHVYFLLDILSRKSLPFAIPLPFDDNHEAATAHEYPILVHSSWRSSTSYCCTLNPALISSPHKSHTQLAWRMLVFRIR